MPILEHMEETHRNGKGMLSFYWLVEGQVAGCSRPGGSNRISSSTVDRQTLVADLRWLKEQGIGALLSLTEDPLPADELEAEALTCLHVPVVDMRSPTPEQLFECLDYIDLERSRGNAVAVHCLMGQGRTGTILAALLVRQGLPAEEAIARLQSICPGALSSEEQRQALKDFDRHRPWLI